MSTEEGQRGLMRGDACYSFLRGFEGDLTNITDSYQERAGAESFCAYEYRYEYAGGICCGIKKYDEWVDLTGRIHKTL